MYSLTYVQVYGIITFERKVFLLINSQLFLLLQISKIFLYKIGDICRYFLSIETIFMSSVYSMLLTLRVCECVSHQSRIHSLMNKYKYINLKSVMPLLHFFKHSILPWQWDFSFFFRLWLLHLWNCFTRLTFFPHSRAYQS